MRWTTALVTVAATAIPLSVALADVPPPPDYVESCTVAKVQQAGQECVSCGDSYHAKPKACAGRLASQGYTEQCRTAGASTWDEIWCRPAAADAPDQPPPNSDPALVAADPGPFATPPELQPGPSPDPEPLPLPPAKSGSCGACAIGTEGSTWPALLLLVALASASLARRRR